MDPKLKNKNKKTPPILVRFLIRFFGVPQDKENEFKQKLNLRITAGI